MAMGFLTSAFVDAYVKFLSWRTRTAENVGRWIVGSMVPLILSNANAVAKEDGQALFAINALSGTATLAQMDMYSMNLSANAHLSANLSPAKTVEFKTQKLASASVMWELLI